MLRVPPTSVRLIHVEGSGCYGHNGADDAAADAALIARAGARHAGARAVDARAGARLGAVRTGDGHQIEGFARRQWRDRRLEFRGLEQHPFDAAGRRGLDAGRRSTSRKPFALPEPKPLPLPDGGGDRNAIPGYTFPNATSCIISSRRCRFGSRRCARSAPITTCSRSRASWTSLALAAGADPVEFRLKHLDDARGRDVITKAAKEFGWKKDQKPAAGSRPRLRLCALQEPCRPIAPSPVEVEVNRQTGRVRGWCGRSPPSTAGGGQPGRHLATRSRAASSSR